MLNGAKCWITNGGRSTWYTVMAVTDQDKGANGISAFIVHKDDEGFSVGAKERKLGIKGSPTTELYFENCRIPADRMIGNPGTGLKTALAALDHTRPTIGAQAVGIAQGALDAAIAYTKQRKQFGPDPVVRPRLRGDRHVRAVVRLPVTRAPEPGHAPGRPLRGGPRRDHRAPASSSPGRSSRA